MHRGITSRARRPVQTHINSSTKPQYHAHGFIDRKSLQCHSTAEQNAEHIEFEPPIVVKSIPPPRPAAPAPQLAPIERSSAYLLRHRRRLESDDNDDDEDDEYTLQDSNTNTGIAEQQQYVSSSSSSSSSSSTHDDFLRPSSTRHPILEDEEEKEGLSPSLSSSPQDELPFSGGAVEWWLKKADKNLNEIEANPPVYAKVMYSISTGPVGAAASKSLEVAAEVGGKVAKEALKAAGPASKWAVQQGFKLMAGVVMKGMSGNNNNNNNNNKRK